jgi:flagellar protein FliO/FliZ
MDSANYLRFILSLVAVLGLIFGVLWVVRQRLPGVMSLRNKAAGRRLGIVESLTLDVKHRLVLVRRDDREHLLILGGGQPVVVESDCPRAAFTLSEPEVPWPAPPKPETGE